MNAFRTLVILLASTLVGAAASPKEEVAGAIKKLAEQSGYAWTYTPKTEGTSAGRIQGPVEGKTEKDGFTYLKGSAGDVTLEIGLKGEKMVVNYNGDWLSTAEIGENNRTVQRLRALKKADQEAAELLGKAAAITKDTDGAYSGDMTAEAAKELFALLGRRAAEAPVAKGSMKFWTKNGQLSRYEFTIGGKITTGEEKREVDVSRTATVEIKDVGATKVSLPDDARRKLW
jgi:hypothetical protein